MKEVCLQLHCRSNMNLKIIFFSILLLGFTHFAYSQEKNKNEKTKKIRFGLYQIAWGSARYKAQLKKATDLLIKKPSYIMFFRDMHSKRGFPLAYIKIIDNANAIPIISLELGLWGKKNKKILKEIIAGKHDTFFNNWFKECKKWKKEVYFRPGFEMNGDWFSWGGDPKNFVLAWKHMHALAQKEKCQNLKWVWSVNCQSFPTKDWNQIEFYYPGNQTVDILGVDGYNWTNELPWRKDTLTKSFNQIFDQTMKTFKKIAKDKPILITEVSCAETKPLKKSKWINDFFKKLNKYPNVTGFIWFNYDKRSEKEPDWRINSSESSLKSFNKGLQLPYIK